MFDSAYLTLITLKVRRQDLEIMTSALSQQNNLFVGQPISKIKKSLYNKSALNLWLVVSEHFGQPIDL